MGGKPLSALNLAGFPKGFKEEWIAAIFRGGFDKVREAGAVLAGGHTVESQEPLFGFAVTGTIDRNRVVANAGAKAGDVLYLTKPLGMGTMTTAGKFEQVTSAELAPAARQMATLNAAAAEAMMIAGPHACTDITGFGLVGHSHNIAQASNVTLRFRLADVPFFPRATELAAQGVLSGGTKRGKAALGANVGIADGSDSARVDIAFDAETSGGLLIVLPAASAAVLERELNARDVPVHCVGEVVERTDKVIELS